MFEGVGKYNSQIDIPSCFVHFISRFCSCFLGESDIWFPIWVSLKTEQFSCYFLYSTSCPQEQLKTVESEGAGTEIEGTAGAAATTPTSLMQEKSAEAHSSLPKNPTADRKGVEVLKDLQSFIVKHARAGAHLSAPLAYQQGPGGKSTSFLDTTSSSVNHGAAGASIVEDMIHYRTEFYSKANPECKFTVLS